MKKRRMYDTMDVMSTPITDMYLVTWPVRKEE
jgi:hypothetical protein